MRDMHECWEAKRLGTPLTNAELRAMLKSAKQALVYLYAYGERFVLTREETVQNIRHIESWLKNRDEMEKMS